jgi:predicted RNase H-like HicB family nuclease
MKEYAVIIERGDTSYGAYVPDLPGCVAVAETEAEVRQLIRKANELHVKAMRQHGDPVPEPISKVEYVAMPLAS